MLRREFLAAVPCSLLAQTAKPMEPLAATAETMFLDLLRGFIVHAGKTSADSYAVVEFPNATVTQNFLAKSGKSATGTTRMLPAIAAWIAGGRQPAVLHMDGTEYHVADIAGKALINGTNPAHPDYWGAPPADAQNQRQVEASIVAWSAWLLRDTVLPQMTPAERSRLDAWLRSCTVREVRNNNWAWFTAVTHAARIDLKGRFDEFSYDQSSMFDDLQALSAMHAGQGWYNDDQSGHAFDYYNSWVFASHFLYWNAMVGDRFPEWSKMFMDRLRAYLETAPLFFGTNGSHILYGRSLIYRFGVLTPLVLAHAQGLWPHDAGMLQKIVRGNLEFHRALNGFDRENGKLRETYSDKGTIDIRESYIDGGHPYWGMQAFSMFLIPREDAFWSDPAAALPVERAGFLRPLEGPGLVLVGHRESGQVKLLQARSSKTDEHYRDKYNKLSYSSHFPFNIIQREDVCPWDNAVVLRDRRRRRSAGRGEIEESRLLADGMEIAYRIRYGDLAVSVRTTVIADGEFEARLHRVIAPADLEPGMELAEGSSALGVETLSDADHAASNTFSIVRNRQTGMLIGSWSGPGWAGMGAAWDFGASETASSNIVYPQMLVNTLWTALKPGVNIAASVHYGSPKPLRHPQLHARARTLIARLQGIRAGTAPPKPAGAKPAAVKPGAVKPAKPSVTRPKSSGAERSTESPKPRP